MLTETSIPKPWNIIWKKLKNFLIGVCVSISVILKVLMKIFLDAI